MKINKAQRVGVFVDVQNMYYSAKNLYKSKVDFAQLLKTAVNERSLIRSICYTIKADIGEEKSFFEALEKIGYEVKSKDLQIFLGGNKKGDWDIGIAMDMIELAPKLDTVVLISGDGDFAELIRHMKHAMGCRVEVMAFGKSASSKIKDAADQFTDLDKYSKNYLRKGTIRSTTRPAQRSHSSTSSRSHSSTSSRPSSSTTPRTNAPARRASKPAPKAPPKLS